MFADSLSGMSTTTDLVPTRQVATVESLKQEIVALTESFAELQIRWEERHWQRIRGSGMRDPLKDHVSISVLKDLASDLRTWQVGGLLKRVSDLRSDTIYGEGVGFSNFARAKSAMTSPNNIAKLYSVQALAEISRAHDSDGQIVFLVHKTTKQIIRVFLDEMEDPYVDGDDNENIWFVQRNWNRVTPTKPLGEDVRVFYATDTCPEKYARRANLKVGNDVVKIDRDYTAVVWKVNGQGGRPYGFPDLVASLKWAQDYSTYLDNQGRFAEALAAIAWEAHADTTDNAKKVAAVVSQRTVAGTSVATPNVHMEAQNGNSDVSFVNGRPMLALAAALGNVTSEDLEAQGQFGTTSMDPAQKRAATARRGEATSIFKRIGALQGAPNLEVIWPDFEQESPFREAQMIVAAWGTGLFKPEEVRPGLAAKLDIPIAEGSKPPADVLIPGTKAYLKAQKAVTAPSGGGTNNAQGNDALGVGKLSNGDNTARDKGETPGTRGKNK